MGNKVQPTPTAQAIYVPVEFYLCSEIPTLSPLCSPPTNPQAHGTPAHDRLFFQLGAFRATSGQVCGGRYHLGSGGVAPEVSWDAFDPARVVAVPHDVVGAEAVVAAGAFFAVVREGEAGAEGVGRGTELAAGNGVGAEEKGGFAEAAAAPVDDHDFAGHFRRF